MEMTKSCEIVEFPGTGSSIVTETATKKIKTPLGSFDLWLIIIIGIIIILMMKNKKN